MTARVDHCPGEIHAHRADVRRSEGDAPRLQGGSVAGAGGGEEAQPVL